MLGPGLSARAKPLASEPDPPGRTLRKPPETGDQHGARASRPAWRPITNIRPGGPPNRGAVQRREGPQQQRGQSHRGIPIARRAAVSTGPGARELPAPGQALVVVEAVEGRQEKRPGLLRRGKGSESLTTCSRGPTSTRGRVVRAVSLMGLTGAYAATIRAGQASDGLSALPRSACVNIPASACGAPPDRRLPRRDEPATHPVPCPPKVGRPWRLVAHLSSSASVPRAGATAPRCPSLSANRGRRRTRVVTKRGD